MIYPAGKLFFLEPFRGPAGAKAKLAVQTVREGFDAFARSALLSGAAEVAAADGDWAKKVAASKAVLAERTAAALETVRLSLSVGPPPPACSASSPPGCL